jgi:hypothetical protein
MMKDKKQQMQEEEEEQLDRCLKFDLRASISSEMKTI